jgi:hypothetical protein
MPSSSRESITPPAGQRQPESIHPPNARGSTMSDKLLNDIDTVAPENLDDLFLIMAKNVEEGLIRGGARPGIDYSILDLYQLAQPFALAIFQKNIETMTYTVRW